MRELTKALGLLFAGLWAMPFLMINFLLSVIQCALGFIADAPKFAAWQLTIWVCRAQRRLDRRQALRDQLPARRGL